MEFEKVCNLIIVAIAIVYTAVMFYFLINLEKQHLAKQQTHQQHVSKASMESEQAIVTKLMVIEEE
ncbi:MAG: hypothetical protein ACEY3E_04475 [Candidatus Tisiphia sp.]